MMSFNLQYIESLLPEDTKQNRIEQINHVLMEIAGGNFNQFAPISDNFDEIDAIASGINMLSEELRDTVINRNYLDGVLRSIVDMLFIFDEKFRVEQVTPKVCEFFQKGEKEFIGTTIDKLFDGRKKKFVQKLKENLTEKGKLQNVEAVFKSAHRENLPVTLSLFSLKDNHGRITGYLMIGEDIKEKLHTSNALKQRNDELKTLIYRTSHDLKGPLASMLGLFNLLEKEQHNMDTIQLYLSHLKNSAIKLNNTLSSLLEIGVVDQSEPVFTSFNLWQMVSGILESMNNYPGREEAEITTDIDPLLDIISGENLLRSVLQNLIENSIKYRQPGRQKVTKISVALQEKKDKIILLVKDNGQGMSKEVIKKAFDMFYRGNEGSKGSGLGLFIVKTNVEKIGGEIKIKSKQHEGTEIKILLPKRKQS